MCGGDEAPFRTGNMAGSETTDRILRAKYLDWCSARVAERFLALTPDEIYQLAEKATHGQPIVADPVASLSSFFAPEHEMAWKNGIDPNTVTTDAEPFRALVAKVTEVLADRIALPTFDEWSAAYQESPQDFDNDLLGFWKEEAQ
jgi:hypothetical protein